MENIQVYRILMSIDSKFLDIGRLIQNGQYAHALTIVNETKRNLARIRTRLSQRRFNIINESLKFLKNNCEEHIINNTGNTTVSNTHAYKVNKIYSGSKSPSLSENGYS